MKNKTLKKKIKKIKKLVKVFFKTQRGEPYEMTTGQAYVFLNIIDPKIKWLWLSAPTRYGKSDILAMALIYLAAVKHLKIPIVAGSADKANKIMEYVVAHIADNALLYQGLMNTDIAKIDQLKISVSKNGLRWYDGGWIYITSVDSRNASKEGEGVVGEGGDVVVLEEAGLIKKKEQFSKIVRMPEDDRGWGKLIQSGNCVEGSVFEDAYNSPLYKKIRITLDRAVKEGRFKTSSLEAKKLQTTSKDWKRYYLVQFPAVNEFTYFKPQKYDLLPKNEKLKYYGALDPALGESKKGSLVGIVVIAKDEDTGQIYEVFNYGEQIGPDEAIKKIFNLPYEFDRFAIEAIQFQKYFYHQIEAKSKAESRYIPFVAITQQRAKEERIESLEPAINTKQILFSGQGELWNEMQDYPQAEKLDVLDTLEMAYRFVAPTGFEFEIL